MTISIATLVGAFEYPPRTLGFLMKKFWDSSKTGGKTPTFLIPNTTTDSKDPWFSGDAPQLVFRGLPQETETKSSIGDGLFMIRKQCQIHLFAVTQQQEFLMQREVNRILKEKRRSPILKYSTDFDTPPVTAVNSGLILFDPANANWREVPEGDPQDPQDITETHSVGIVDAVWFEHRT